MKKRLEEILENLAVAREELKTLRIEIEPNEEDQPVLSDQQIGQFADLDMAIKHLYKANDLIADVIKEAQ